MRRESRPPPARGAASAIRIRLPCPLARRIVMSIVVRFHPMHLTIAQYDDVVRREEGTGKFPPEGRDYHVCFGTDGDLRVSEIWYSQEQLQAYGEVLLPILA